jgi:predicted MFS family arabinose efflux permease
VPSVLLALFARRRALPAAPVDLPGPPRLWRDGDFRRLWAGETASQFGEQAGQVAVPLVAVVTLHSGAAQLGALRAVQQAPMLLFSLFVGVWVDRHRSRDVMVLADVGRAVTLAAIPLAYLLGGLRVPLLYGVAFLVGALTVCFDVAYHACLVRLVGREQLAQGNSALEGSRSAAQIGGPALGGALVSLLSAPVAVGGSACLFLVSSGVLRGIRRDEGRVERGIGRGERPRVWRQIHEGLQLVARDSFLRAVGIASALFQFSFAALMTVYLLFLPRTLHLSGAAVGLVLAAMGPGAVAGSLLAGRLPARFGYGLVIVGSALLGDAVMLGVPELHGSSPTTVVVLMAVNFQFGFFSQLVDVTVMAIRQAVTPIHLQGRVVATLNFAGLGLSSLGSLLGGYLALSFGFRTALLLTAAALILSPAFMSVSPISRLGKSLPAQLN